ncbi:MAG: ParB/RepB/Spo0J family partition protein [Desulfobacterales bacterium]|nr:ParB/RepB/Spo0J family partition protein [Desulfobacterales bacterium]
MDSKSSDDQDVSQDIPSGHTVRYQAISQVDIDTEDLTFRITTRRGIEDLLGSIQKTGLIQPPVLIENPAGYSIVCGFRRIAACRKLGWTRITARILEKPVDRFKSAQLSIADNALQRSLNLVETSRALKLLDDFGPDNQQRREAAEALGLPISGSLALAVKEICQLPLPVQEGILADTINLSMALDLGGLEPLTAEGLVRLFDQLKVGLNKQRELLLLLKEIAEREQITIRQLIAEKPLQEVLKTVEMDRAVKRQKVRSYLRQRRFPAITTTETEYRKWVKQLKLGNNINLIPPKDFEGNTFSMTLRFNNRQDLSDLNKKIEEIIQHPALGKILD